MGGMWEGGCGQDGVEWGGEWDNCNSIINKYIKNKEKRNGDHIEGYQWRGGGGRLGKRYRE